MTTPSTIPTAGTAPTPQVPGDVGEDSSTASATPELTKEARQKAITTAYSKASTWLREQHRDEFHAQIKQQLTAQGIDWSPQPTKAEKARAEIERLATEAGLTVQVG